MAGERWHIWSWVGLALLGAVTVAAVAFIFRAPDRDAASKLVGTLVTVTVSAIGGAAWLWARRRPETVLLPVEHAADQLAEQLRQLWERAATERGLTYPTLIPVRWRWSDRQVTGPVTQAVTGAGGTCFVPLPGMAAITTERS